MTISSDGQREYGLAAIVTAQTVFCQSGLGRPHNDCFEWSEYAAESKVDAAEIAIVKGWNCNGEKWICPWCTVNLKKEK